MLLVMALHENRRFIRMSARVLTPGNILTRRNSSQDIALSSSQDIALSSSQDIKLSSNQDIALSSSQDIKLSSNQDIALSSSQVIAHRPAPSCPARF